MFEKNQIVKKSVDFSGWYTDVILKAELADYAPVKGCMVIRPYGYSLWERIQEFLGGLIKSRGVQNAYFPIFIPESFLKKEKEHVEGFSPHLAVVTIAGGEELKEKLVVRPTSETIMYEMYKKWTHSYRDLPVLINQWNNVVRWEKRTYLFLRTSEFLWQEGHCAHRDHEDSLKTVKWALDSYISTYQSLMAMYGIAGIKSESEKFAGAVKTYSYEMLMPDGKVLQGGTSHDLGQNFSKAFDWTVQDKDGSQLFPWQNSWGLSTRSIGGLVMAHGDDNGLVLPPKIAPIQAVLIPIIQTPAIAEFCMVMKKELEEEGIRVKIDDREEKTVGWKFNEWELKGVPVRIEIGTKELESGKLTIFRRDTNEKLNLPTTNYQLPITKLLNEIQKSLFEKNKKFVEENTRNVESYEKFKQIMKTKKGFIKAFWCEDPVCETKIKEETKATTRVLPLEAKEEKGQCIYCAKPAVHRWYFAQAY